MKCRDWTPPPMPVHAMTALLWQIARDRLELEREAVSGDPLDRFLIAVMRARELHVHRVLAERRTRWAA